MNFEFHIPSATLYGKGTLKEVAAQASLLRMKNVLIVSDQYLGQSGLVGEVVKLLEAGGLRAAVFSDVTGEPEIKDVENGLAILRENDCDGVLCIGGGSSIDTGKAVAVMAKNDGGIADYMGYHRVKNQRLPLIAVPTTAGTGSEMTRVVVITDVDRGVKMMCLDNAFMPDAAIVDYSLSISMPKNLTAFVGLDALTHAIEAYVSKKAGPVSDMFALLAIRLISADIMNAYNEPDNELARENMMLGANYAGIAFSNSSVCAVHGMSRPLGANFHVPHGLSNAMLLPLITERGIESTHRYADVAVSMGYSELASRRETALQAVDMLKMLNEKLSIPNLKEYGVLEREYTGLIPSMVEAAIASGSPANNPKEFTADEMCEMYEKAYDYK